MKLMQALKRSNGCLEKINDVLREGGFEARLVGGAVRDLMLAHQPKDFDIATNADPEMVASLFQAKGYKVVPTGLQHGTVTVVCNGEPYEVTTLRKDLACDGRHAVVQFTEDWVEDARRRDFTFNAMSLSLETGELYDYFGGEEDLLNGRVRFVGSALERIREDRLRILRFFRFLGRYEHFRELDQDAVLAITEEAPQLQLISGERIWMEMSKILKSNRIAMLSVLMEQSRVLDSIGLVSPGTEHMSFGHCPDVTELENVRRLTDNPVTMLAALMLFRKSHGVPTLNVRHMRMNVETMWKPSRAESDLLTFLLNHYRPRRLTHEIDFYLDLAVDDGGKDRVLELAALMGDENARDYIAHKVLPEFPVRGQDLLDAGMPPGPDVGQKLAQLRRIWIGSRYNLDREELLEEL